VRLIGEKYWDHARGFRRVRLHANTPELHKSKRRSATSTSAPVANARRVAGSKPSIAADRCAGPINRRGESMNPIAISWPRPIPVRISRRLVKVVKVHKGRTLGRRLIAGKAAKAAEARAVRERLGEHDVGKIVLGRKQQRLDDRQRRPPNPPMCHDPVPIKMGGRNHGPHAASCARKHMRTGRYAR
jgi:hypothetical protein